MKNNLAKGVIYYLCKGPIFNLKTNMVGGILEALYSNFTAINNLEWFYIVRVVIEA